LFFVVEEQLVPTVQHRSGETDILPAVQVGQM